jgi:type III pantothenate kinase
MLLLFDIGNTHTHLGQADHDRVSKAINISTASCLDGSGKDRIEHFVGRHRVTGAAICSVVPKATPCVIKWIAKSWRLTPFVLSSRTAVSQEIDYPKPATIGPDRLANAIAAKHYFGAPVVVVDFGTAVTFDVVDRRGAYIGGIIAPGISAMTSYLHEKTALLPNIRIREVDTVVGKSTTEAMLIGAVHGYRGLIRELLMELKGQLHSRKLPVVATGGYAELIAAKLPAITSVKPNLTLEGLRLAFLAATCHLPPAA